MNIAITVSSKIATVTSPSYAVNDNTDYTVVFTFDSEWDDLSSKTARFAYLGGYTDVVFSGTSCTMPKLSNCDLCLIGVYAGDLHTTTPAKLPMVRSILKSGGSPIAPSSSVYDQIMAYLNGFSASVTKTGAVATVTIVDPHGTTTANINDGSAGVGIASISYKESTSAGNVYTVTMTDGTTYEITAPKGPAGEAADHAELTNLDYASSGHTGFQATISDLATIRSGAALGATAVQPLQSTLLIDRTLTEDAVLNFTQDDNGNALSLDYCRVIIYLAKGSATAQQTFTVYGWSGVHVVASAWYATISTTILSGTKPGTTFYFFKKAGIWESLITAASGNIGGTFGAASVGTGVNWFSLESAYPKITKLTTTAALLSGTRIQVYGA